MRTKRKGVKGREEREKPGVKGREGERRKDWKRASIE
jgi:hypothetical protein